MEEMEINLKSDICKDMLRDIDIHIQRCLGELSAEKFQGGDINIKIAIETVNAEDEPNKTDKDGGYIPDNIKYAIPKITYKTSLVLKKKHDTDGMYFNKAMELIETDGKYIAREIQSSQINLKDVLKFND